MSAFDGPPQRELGIQSDFLDAIGFARQNVLDFKIFFRRYYRLVQAPDLFFGPGVHDYAGIKFQILDEYPADQLRGRFFPLDLAQA